MRAAWEPLTERCAVARIAVARYAVARREVAQCGQRRNSVWRRARCGAARAGVRVGAECAADRAVREAQNRRELRRHAAAVSRAAGAPTAASAVAVRASADRDRRWVCDGHRPQRSRVEANPLVPHCADASPGPSPFCRGTRMRPRRDATRRREGGGVTRARGDPPRPNPRPVGATAPLLQRRHSVTGPPQQRAPRQRLSTRDGA